MKHFSKILVAVALMASTSAFAQSFKFGHFNSQELIALMPERDSALVVLEKHANDLDEELHALQTEFQTKYTTYQQKQASWTAAVLEAKTKDLQDLESRIQRYQQTAQQEYTKLQEAIFSPILKKANDAIQKIGKENGFIYIFDISTGALPYISEEFSVDVLPLAKKELNIPADKKIQ